MSLANSPTYTPRLQVLDTTELANIETGNLITGDIAATTGASGVSVAFYVLLKDSTVPTSSSIIYSKNAGSTVTNPGRWALLQGMSPFGGAGTAQARNVVPANTSLSSYTVAGNDGITNVAGDVVLLVAQTAASANGLYTVGVVTTGTAALTRAPDFATGSVSDGLIIQVKEGTLFSDTEWKLITSNPITVGTTALDFYPKSVTQLVTFVAGSFTVSNVPVLSSTKSNFIFTRMSTTVLASLTWAYGPLLGGPVPGSLTVGSVKVTAQLSSGTIAVSDASIGLFSILNW